MIICGLGVKVVQRELIALFLVAKREVHCDVQLQLQATVYVVNELILVVLLHIYDVELADQVQVLIYVEKLLFLLLDLRNGELRLSKIDPSFVFLVGLVYLKLELPIVIIPGQLLEAYIYGLPQASCFLLRFLLFFLILESFFRPFDFAIVSFPF